MYSNSSLTQNRKIPSIYLMDTLNSFTYSFDIAVSWWVRKREGYSNTRWLVKANMEWRILTGITFAIAFFLINSIFFIHLYFFYNILFWDFLSYSFSFRYFFSFIINSHQLLNNIEYVLLCTFNTIFCEKYWNIFGRFFPMLLYLI